jgi:acyl carrier protein
LANQCVGWQTGRLERQHARFRSSLGVNFRFTTNQSKPGGYMETQTRDIEQEIRKFLTETFLFGRSEALSDDAPLLGNVIDSTGVIELIVFVQERFTIAVDDEEVTTDNLGSIKNVVAFIEKKLAAKDNLATGSAKL